MEGEGRQKRKKSLINAGSRASQVPTTCVYRIALKFGGH